MHVYRNLASRAFCLSNIVQKQGCFLLIFYISEDKMPWGQGCTYIIKFIFCTFTYGSVSFNFFFCFSCIGLTLSKNNCSNKTFVGFTLLAELYSTSKRLGLQENPSRAYHYGSLHWCYLHLK